MYSRIAAVLLFGSSAILSESMNAQDGARQLLQLPEEQQVAFAREVIQKDFPAENGDRFSFLLINRSALVVPLLEDDFRTNLRKDPRPEKKIAMAAEMLSYAGNEVALRAISRLLPLDEKRFRPLVSRTLDHSMNWYNPFDLAYQSHEMGDPNVWSETVKWVRDAVTRESGKRRWAEALNKRYGTAELDAKWDDDPIARELNLPSNGELRRELIRMAEEERNRPARR